MGLIKNAINFGNGFNIGAVAPIDSRMRVEFLSDLTTVWTAEIPAYRGMIVTVMETSDVYVLKDVDNYTNITSWVKLGSADAASNGAANALIQAKAYTDQLANSAVKTNTEAIATLNGDAETDGSVAKAVATEKARALAAESGLTAAIDDEAAAREAADQAINDTIGEVETGKTLVEMIKAAEAAAIAAATVVAEDSEFVTIEQTGEVGKTQTYTIKTQNIASISDLATEISRAQEAEQANTDAIDSIKSDYLKSSDKLELSQAIVSETEARIQAISNLEFKNSLKLDGVVQSEELLDTLSDVQSGALYSVGPDSNDQYKLYAYVNNSWTYMGYLNSSSIDITQSLGQSQNLAISQKAVTDALTPIIMTQAEFDALVSNGTITDDDLTIRYIID